MSACISHHGEYFSHEPGDDFRCQLCGVLDEDALIERVKRAEAVIAEALHVLTDDPLRPSRAKTILATYQNGADHDD